MCIKWDHYFVNNNEYRKDERNRKKYAKRSEHWLIQTERQQYMYMYTEMVLIMNA